jgi:chemotaxis protein CheX
MKQTQLSAQRLRLPEVLNLTFAGPLAQSFLALRGAELAIDAAFVQRIGAQCVQVIMSAVSTWKVDEVALCVINPSPEFCETFSLLGIGLADISTEEAAP